MKISIITVTYQAEKVLKQTTDSVLQQTYDEVEHIIVDGASKDGTLTMAFDYKRASDMRGNGHVVKVVSEPDNGIYDAMNKGLLMAKGDYVVFLNAGDSLPTKTVLAEIAGEVGRLEVLPAVVYGDTDIVDADGWLLHPRRLAPPEQLSWRSFRQGMLVCHQAFYARTDIARRLPYNLQYRFSADVDWCIRVMKEAERMQLPLLNMHQSLACYLEEGQTTQNHKASLGERFDVMSSHYGMATTVCMHLWFVVRAALGKLGFGPLRK